MGLWSFYFLAKVYLSFRGYIRLAFLMNLVFAGFLLLPIPQKFPARRLFTGVRFTVALVIAFLILWHETWFPSLRTTIQLLSETGGISPSYIIRFLKTSVSILEVGILLLILIACILLGKRITLTPLALAGICAVPLLAAKGAGTDMGTYLEQFYRSEAKKTVHFPQPDAGRPPFDVIILNICSLSWDDLRAVNMDNDPFLKQFDLLFTNFNTVSSHTTPSALRLLRAACGQTSHSDVYRETRNECYPLEALRKNGYTTYAAIDNDAPSYRFVEDIILHGRADKPIEMRDLPIRQIDFDNTPIHDDLALLNRWWDMRLRSPSARAALYADLTTLHGGAHWADESQWWKKDRHTYYREFAQQLFSNLSTFFRTVEESGRNAVVILIPEHGMALRGSSIQAPEVREIPLPSITTVPAGIKFIGKGFSAIPENQVIVSKPTSYHAYAHLLSAL
ncbi:MAG TPA: cellulose biosynthesis protein BcsG, partial [Thermodesulfovibrionales bacterium]|nr:cellulose biosynthesis protein BcsG [Thermodesulfovibrionales bacterium]